MRSFPSGLFLIWEPTCVEGEDREGWFQRFAQLRPEWSIPTTCPDLDLLCIPGGPGISALLEDEQVLAFVRRQGEQARYVTSVCTGALVFGAAWLLKGYNAATHWASAEFLPHFGAMPAKQRVCVDRNRVTGGGVTAGIDFALHLTAQLTDRKTAERIQLYMEYNPEPPFQAGHPDTAPAEVIADFRALAKGMLDERRDAVARAAAKLGQPSKQRLDT